MMEEKKVVKVEDIKKEADEKKCPVERALFYVDEFLAGPMCGRCFPCALGTYEAKIRLRNIMDRKGEGDDIVALKRIAEDMLISSFCKKGKDTARFILEWMETDVFQEHVEGRCPDMDCLAFVEYMIIPEKCIMCGLCKDVCEYRAVIGEKKERFKSGYPPYEIKQKKCVKCGECMKVCPTKAVILIEVPLEATVDVS